MLDLTLARLSGKFGRLIAMLRELYDLPSSVRAQRSAINERWRMEDEFRLHHETVVMPAYRRSVEAIVREDPSISLTELARRCPGPSFRLPLH